MTETIGTKQTVNAPTQRLILTIAILASFIAFLDGSIINVALPAITKDLHGGLQLQQWIVDSYLLTLGSLILVAGSLSDMFGRIRLLRLGLTAFGITSVICALAPSGSLLIAARTIQGVAAAILVPSSLALITSTFRGKAQGPAIGRWSAWTSIAFVAGPLIGGVLVDHFSWRWVFGINVIPISVALFLLTKVQEPRRTSGTPHVDYPGAALAVLGLGGSVFGLIEHARHGWTNPDVFIPLALGGVGVLAFIGWERRSKAPMMPLELFGTRNFWAGNAATVFIWGAASLGLFIIPVFVQQVAGLSATLAGVVTAPMSIVSLVASGTVGTLVSRFGPRWFIATGPCFAASGFLWMLSTRAPVNVWSEVLPGVILLGLGMAICSTAVTTAVLSAISSAQSGIGSAINNMAARVSGLVAVATVGIIANGTLTFPSFHRVVLVIALMFLVGGALAAVAMTNARQGASPTTGLNDQH